MSQFVLGLFLIVFQQAYATTECDKAQRNFRNHFLNLEKAYQSVSKNHVSKENKPYWQSGANGEAVYLLHGFIGTPEEMSQIANQLHERGFTVVNDIIPGYGVDGKVANAFDSTTWLNYIDENIQQVERCTSKIHFIGFSTGGLLLHKYLRDHSDLKAQSLTLYSPFYRPHLSFTQFLKTATRWLTSTVSTKLLYDFSRFPDIKIAVLKPNNYLQDIPLDGAQFVLDLGKQVDDQISKNKLKDKTTPVLLFVSETDQILNLDSTVKNVSADFSKLQIVKFSNQYVPHHLFRPEVSDVADRVLRQTADFISAH